MLNMEVSAIAGLAHAIKPSSSRFAKHHKDCSHCHEVESRTKYRLQQEVVPQDFACFELLQPALHGQVQAYPLTNVLDVPSAELAKRLRYTKDRTSANHIACLKLTTTTTTATTMTRAHGSLDVTPFFCRFSHSVLAHASTRRQDILVNLLGSRLPSGFPGLLSAGMH